MMPPMMIQLHMGLSIQNGGIHHLTRGLVGEPWLVLGTMEGRTRRTHVACSAESAHGQIRALVATDRGVLARVLIQR